ncbi:MAG TPA: type VII secretion protein EccCb, partial [Mycobacterium sp.]|nr:type VII secretion protein EccCb [Mycobacterium sp.]
LNLVLVDFKGGATFLGFEDVRHVAAIITNLADEAHLVARMNDALAGELHRRQELLRAAGRFANIEEYRRARAADASLPPLPALMVIVDEFSELLTQHPDFAELFVAIGRLGRSLGIHLLLASQRLDEGRLRGLDTHLSYRICLKTFSASESRAVLGVPDAHQLPSTPGAALLKTAAGELIRFQTAFVSGPCPRRADRPQTALPMEFTAAAVHEPRRGPETGGDTVTPTVSESVLMRVAGRGAAAHRLWLPPLLTPPTLDMLTNREMGPLNVPIGLVDKPFDQRREPLVAQLAGAGGNVAVVGAPRSGKSTALRSLILALAEVHGPAEVGFYCLDFGGGALSSLRGIPHVGSVAGRHEVELCRRTLAVVESVMRKREDTFRRRGIDSMAQYRVLRAAGDPVTAEDPYGDVFLVIDGWATLRQQFEALEAPITAIAAQGLSFGVHVVLTASRWAELRPALKDQIATRIELRLGDPAESEMDRRRARLLANSRPGRGITPDGKDMVIALPRWDGERTATGLTEAIAATVGRLRDRWTDQRAPRVELLPAVVCHRDVVEAARDRSLTQAVIGLDEQELQPVVVDFGEQPHLVALGETGCGKSSLLRLLCGEVVRTGSADQAQLEIVDFRRSLLGVVESEHLSGYSASPAALTTRLQKLLSLLEARMPGEHVTQQQLRDRSWWSGPEIFLVVDDYDLVAASTGNPLAPLADFLPQAADLGFHVVVARRSGGAARAMFDPVLARMREVGCIGLMMSASPDEGVLLGSVRPSPQPPGRGTLITRSGGEHLVQIGWVEPP